MVFFNMKAQDVFEKPELRDVVAVGYQIGGYTLIGLDIEKRLTNVIGIHAGGGFLGYTAGVKLHTGPRKDSPFFNLSFKDAGMGLMNVYACEYGARLFKSQIKETAFHLQVGIARINQIDRQFSKRLFDTYDAPYYMLSAGVGISW